MPTFDTAMPSTMVVDEGFITINGSTPYCIMKGPISITFGLQRQNMDYAGKRAPTMLLDRFIYADCKITGTAMALSSTTTPVWFPGSTQAGSSTLTVTLNPMSEFLVAGDYQTQVRGIFRRSDAKYVSVTMPVALVMATGLEGADKDSVGMPIEINAIQDLRSSTDTDVIPFTVQILTTL